MSFISEKRLYRTADDRVVEEGDPAAAFLLVGEGGTLDDETARRYGLIAESKEPAKTKAPADNKAVSKAPANKGK